MTAMPWEDPDDPYGLAQMGMFGRKKKPNMWERAQIPLSALGAAMMGLATNTPQGAAAASQAIAQMGPMALRQKEMEQDNGVREMQLRKLQSDMEEQQRQRQDENELLGMFQPKPVQMADASSPSAAPPPQAPNIQQIMQDPRFAAVALRSKNPMIAEMFKRTLPEAAKVPEGFTSEGGRLAPIPGGPQDPSYLGQRAEATRATKLLSPEEEAQQARLRAAGRSVTSVNVSGEKKGSEVLYQKTAEAFDVAQLAERSALKNAELYDRMAQAGKAFRTGALAEERLGAQRMLQELGVSVDPNTSEGEVLRQLGSRLQVTSAPKGQGQISNYERQLFAQAVPTMSMTPQGLQKSIEIAKKLDEFDRKIAKVYRDNARRGGGVPDPVSVNEEISAIGSPLTQREMAMIGGDRPPLTVETPSSGTKKVLRYDSRGNRIK